MLTICRLAFKLTAIAALLVALGPGSRAIPALIAYWAQAEGDLTLLLAASLLLPVIFPLLIAAGLWFGAENLARKTSHERDIEINLVTGDALEVVSFSILGGLVLVMSVPHLGKIAYYYWQLSVPGGVELGNYVERMGSLLEVSLEIALGIALVLRPAGMARLLRKIRND